MYHLWAGMYHVSAIDDRFSRQRLTRRFTCYPDKQGIKYFGYFYLVDIIMSSRGKLFLQKML